MMKTRIYKWWRHLENQSPQEKTDVVEENLIINPEFEEKPIVPANQNISEDFHGGQELTFSIEDNNREISLENENKEEEQDITKGDDTLLEGLEVEESNPDDYEKDLEESNNNKENQLESEEVKHEESSDDQGTFESPEGGQEEDEEIGEDDYEDYYEEDSDEDVDDGSKSYSRNDRAVVSLRDMIVSRSLATAFQRFIERIAEVETKYEVPGYEALSIKQVMKRVLDRRGLNNCRVNRLKDAVILLVDVSGSMMWWKDTLSKMVSLALKRKDIEIYESPNMRITRPLKSFKQLEETYNWDDYRDHHIKFLETTKNRVIVVIADYDGADVIRFLGFNNKVYWICNENRYDDTCDHSWNYYCLSTYPKNVKIAYVSNEQDLLNAISNPKAFKYAQET